jgi:glycosyltransferase involved in cell wall biosynthesis
MSFRLGIVATHPIQYQVPWFRRLAAQSELEVKILYCQIPDACQQGIGFGVDFQWDIPLLEGYDSEVLKNSSADPVLGTFRGCDTPQIGERIRACGFDAVLVSGWNAKSYLQALRACRKFGIPCLVRGESNALQPRPWWKRFLHRQFLRRFSACLVIGKSNADFYRQNGVPEERLFPAWYCVDNNRFASQADKLRAEREKLRSQWNIGQNKVVFLFCAKFIEKKRPLDFLRALGAATGQGAPVHGLLVGDGELRPNCEAFARERALPVTFAGFLNQTELPRAYVAADCLVLPSDYGETWGLVVNEAMACGLPAVVSDRVGCGPDLVIEGQTGRVFPFGDHEALANSFAELAKGPSTTLCRMGQAARKRIAAYSIEAAAQGTLDAVRFVSRQREAAVGAFGRNEMLT